VTAGAASDVVNLLRELAPQTLAVLVRRGGDFDLAEDAMQEALFAASRQWPVAGVPTNPRGWLYQVALRRMHDAARSESARRRREEESASETAPFAPPPDAPLDTEQDDALVMLFMCTHPALTTASAIALTLRAVGGLTTAEIASAFLVPEATMAQRISRAKATIKASGVPFRMPGDAERPARLAAVRHVLYLVFNEGYATSSGGGVHRTDLSAEAIRLARTLHALVPDDPETTGLLALMLLTDARRPARTGPNGELVPLDEQDRSRWDRGLIDEGTALVSRALSCGAVGPYQLQAAVAALHDEATHVDRTDWPQILALYRVLEAMADNPMVTLNRAVAEAMVGGPEAGLRALEPLDDDSRLRDHHRLHAIRAHLHERLGDLARAAAGYRAAAGRTSSAAERDWLLLRAARLGAAPLAVDGDAKP
jgi:RNA polymerase sigma factor (sigma-70 family)